MSKMANMRPASTMSVQATKILDTCRMSFLTADLVPVDLAAERVLQSFPNPFGLGLLTVGGTSAMCAEPAAWRKTQAIHGTLDYRLPDFHQDVLACGMAADWNSGAGAPPSDCAQIEFHTTASSGITLDQSILSVNLGWGANP